MRCIVIALLVHGSAPAFAATITVEGILAEPPWRYPEAVAGDRYSITFDVEETPASDTEVFTERRWGSRSIVNGRTTGNPEGFVTFTPNETIGGIPSLSFNIRDDFLGSRSRFDSIEFGPQYVTMTVLDLSGRKILDKIGLQLKFSTRAQDRGLLDGTRLIDVPTIVSELVSSDFKEWLTIEYSSISPVLCEVDMLQVIHDDLTPGDANADGVFGQTDVVQVLSANKYLTGDIAAWAQGDWTGDGLFNQLDIIAALPHYSAASSNSVVSVPEPSAICLLLVGILSFLSCRVTMTIEDWPPPWNKTNTMKTGCLI